MKVCKLCDEPFERPARGRPSPCCSPMCRRVFARRKRGTTAGEGAECCVCGELFIKKMSKSTKCENCRGSRPKVYVDCFICGKSIVRTGANRINCPTKCVPPEGWTRECSCCGEPKGIDGFYDYRGKLDGKLLARCKTCQIKATLKKN